MRNWTLVLILSASLQAQTRPAIDTARAIDLTYDYDEKTVYWPTAKWFEFQRESWGMSAGGYWYSAGRFSASEHGGTHLDSPIHFGQGQASTERIPLSKLIAPAAGGDIVAACRATPHLPPSAPPIKTLGPPKAA